MTTHFFRNKPTYDRNTGKQIFPQFEDDEHIHHAFINGHVVPFDKKSEVRFSPTCRNMQYLGRGDFLYTYYKIIPDNEEEQTLAKVVLTARKFGTMNIRTAEVLQDIKNAHIINDYTIRGTEISLIMLNNTRINIRA